MHFKDKLLHCVNCHKDFIFTVENQEFHAAKGFINEPTCCLSCRQTKRSPHLQVEEPVWNTSHTGSYHR